MTQAPAVGIDIGGTKIAGALVAPDGSITRRERLETPEETGAILDAVARLVSSLRTGEQVCGIGIACAALVDARSGHLWWAPNLPWRDLDIGEEVGRRVDAEVLIENDANAAAWGEYRYGAGRDCEDMVLATVGTGVGGGCIVGDRLLRGAFGFGGEIGHIAVDPQGPRCGCGNDGCLEALASGTALERSARELARSADPAGARLRQRCADNPESLTGRDVTELAEGGDEGSRRLLADLGRNLGAGMASISAVLDPRLVVIGGGVVTAGDLLLEPAREAFAARLVGGGHRPPPALVPASLGNDAGLVGAATLAREGLV